MVQCVESLGQVHKYICFISFIQIGSRTIAPRGKFPPNTKTNPNPILNPNQGTLFLRGNCLVAPPPPRTLKLTLTLTETATLSVGQFSSGGGGWGVGGVLDYFPNFQSYLAVHAVHYGSCEILFTYLKNLSLIICINLRVNKFFKDF